MMKIYDYRFRLHKYLVLSTIKYVNFFKRKNWSL